MKQIVDTVKCDFCNDEVSSCWTYTTLNTASSAREAEAGKGFWCEDPEWAMCETCHYVLTTQGAAKLFEHSFLRQCLTIKVKATSRDPKVERYRRAVADIQLAFHENLDPNRPPYFEKDVTLHGTA